MKEAADGERKRSMEKKNIDDERRVRMREVEG
jgi:hypothetical protein